MLQSAMSCKKSTRFSSVLKRVQRVMQEELTPLQRETLIAFYFQEQTLTQIAADRGVNKSTVCRTLKRAEAKLRRYLKY